MTKLDGDGVFPYATNTQVQIEEPIGAAADVVRPASPSVMLQGEFPLCSRPKNSGPWSIDWLANIPKFKAQTISKSQINHQPSISKKKKIAGCFKQPVRNLKRIASLPLNDRREILQILKKQAKKRKARTSSQSSKSEGNA